MKCATIQASELSILLLRLISLNDKSTMNLITNEIFSMIKQFDKDNLYGLSIALTNYFFETFALASQLSLQEGKTKQSHDILEWSCKIAWEQDKIKNYKFHKGTPYFFLGRSYLTCGNIDLGFQMVHCGHDENLITYPKLKLIFPELNLDYKLAPSYLFMVLNTKVPDNALYDFVLIMKGKIDQFVRIHNDHAPTPITYELFDQKFLQRPNSVSDEIKFVLVYLLMNLVNLDKYDRKPLNENSFSNLKKIEVMRSLSLIVDKTLAEKYGTKYIKDGAIQYMIHQLSIPEKEHNQYREALSYSDGSPFDMSEDVEKIACKILADELRHSGAELSYPKKCMTLVWILRNFSTHNLSGIKGLLTESYESILSILFSALFFSAEVL